MAENRRSVWLTNRADALVSILRDRHQLDVSVDAATADIESYRDQIAERLRIQPRSANRYITDEILTEYANFIAEKVEEAKNAAAGIPTLSAERRKRFPPPSDAVL